LHEPNDDRRFPGRQLQQISDLSRLEEWSVARITDHHGAGSDALFEVEYTTGDRVWLPYHEVSRLEAVGQYLEAVGAPTIKHLPKKISTTTPVELSSASVPGNFQETMSFIDAAINDLVKEYDRNPTVFKNRQELPSDCKHVNFHPQSEVPHVPMTNPIEVALYKEFSRRITSGTYNPRVDDRDIPDGYFAYCWAVRDHEDPSERLPIPAHLSFDTSGIGQMPSAPAEDRDVQRPAQRYSHPTRRGRTSRPQRNELRQAQRETRNLSQLVQRTLEAELSASKYFGPGRQSNHSPARSGRVVTRRESYDLDRQIHHDQRKDKGRRSARDRHHHDEPPSRLPRFPNRSLDNRQNPQSRHGRVPPIVRREDLYNPGLGGGNSLVNPQDWAAVDALMRDHGMTDSTFSPSITPGPETRLTTPSSDDMPGMCPTRTSTVSDDISRLIHEPEQASLPDQAPAPALGSGTANGRTQGSSSTDAGASLCWVAAVVILITALVASDLSSLVLSQA
jgi:hypothetical protein